MPTPLGFPTPADSTRLALVYSEMRDLANAVDTAIQAVDTAIQAVINRAQSGTRAFATTSGNVTSSNVVFATPFASLPQVVAAPVSPQPNGVSCSVQNVTTTGFTLLAYRHATGSATSTFSWIAVQT